LESTVYKKTATKENSEGEFLVYKCDANECIQYKSNYYLHAFDDTNKKLYKCATDKCEISSTFAVGYYLTGPSSTELLTCTTADNASSCSKVGNISSGCYKSGDSTYKLINCSGSPLTCEGIDEPVGFYIDASNNKNIYTCDTNSCTSAVPLKGIYINAGATDSVINCGSEKCQEDSVTATACSKAGDLIKSGNDIKLCISDKADEAKKINPPAADTYMTFESGTTFPGAPSSKNFNIKLSREGAVYLLEEAKISTCEATDAIDDRVCLNGHTNTQHCITSENKLLKISGSNCEAAVRTAGNVFIGDDYTSVTFAEASDTAKYGYSCDASSVCEIIKGYIIDDNNIIKCSGWIGDPCIATAKGTDETCSTSTKDGVLLSNGTKVCFGTNEYTLTDIATILAFHLNDFNSNYGMNKDDVVIVSASEDKVIVTTIESGK